MADAERALKLLLHHEVDSDEDQYEQQVYWKQIPQEDFPMDLHGIDSDIDKSAKDPVSGLVVGSVQSILTARGESSGFATGVPVIGYVHHRAVATARFRDGRVAFVIAESSVEEGDPPASAPMKLRVVE